MIASAPQAAVEVTPKAHIESCQNRQADMLILSGRLRRPETDRVAAAAEARGIEHVCQTAATALLADERTEPCGRMMLHFTEVAAGLADVYEGRRTEAETPGLLIPNWQANSLRCHQIVQGEQS